MKKYLLGGLAAALVVGISASGAMAQCAFMHPAKAKKFQANFVQAMVSCGNAGGQSPNTTTEGGVPACKPPETFNAQAGSPTSGWDWDPAKAQASVQFKASKIKGAITPATGADLAVNVKMKGILDGTNAGANGTGALATLSRATFNDRMNGDITVVDFPANFAVTVTDGKGGAKTSADALLNGISQPSLPNCTSIETVSVTLVDPNGNTFGSLGVFLP